MTRSITRLFAALLLIVALAPLAQADTQPGAPNSYLTQINVRELGALGDTLTFPDGTVALGSTAFSSASATFQPTDVNKTIAIDNIGAADGSAPLTTTIAAYVDAHHVTLASPAAIAAPYTYVTYLVMTTPQSGAGDYAAGDTIVLAGGTGTSASVSVRSTQVMALSINAPGSGGTNGSCVISGTTGAGRPFRINATISGGALTSLGTFVNAGMYTTNPTSKASEPVTGCSLVGATVAITNMGVRSFSLSNAGKYSVLPGGGSTTAPVGQASTTGTGTGFIVNIRVSENAGSFTYGTDDSAAFVAAINTTNANLLAGVPTCVYVPAGNYKIVSALPIFTYGGCVRGEGHSKSNVRLDPSYVGDLFSWSEAWAGGGAWVVNGSQVIAVNRMAPSVEGIGVFADRTAPQQQNAFMFYDSDDEVYMRDIDVHYLRGRALGSGFAKNVVGRSYLRESHFESLRFFRSGDVNTPVVEFASNSVGSTSTEASNEIVMHGIEVYAPYGPGVVMRALVGSMREFRVSSLRIEGEENNMSASTGDLLQIGDAGASYLGTPTNMMFTDLHLVDPFQNYCAMRVTAHDVGEQPFGIFVGSGDITGGLSMGAGVCLDAGRSNFIRMSGISTNDYNLTTGTTPLVGTNNVFDFGGNEALLTYNDQSGTLRKPLLTNLSPASTATLALSANGLIADCPPDGTIACGNTRGANAVDLSTGARTASTQIASGASSTIAGGQNNTVTNSFGTIGGGWNNIINGRYSTIPGGQSAVDRGRFAIECMGTVGFGVQGGAQRCAGVLRATGNTATLRLTADGGTANANNCINTVSNGLRFGMKVSLIAYDKSDATKNGLWTDWKLLMTRDTGAASVVVVPDTLPTPLTTGSVSGMTISATADTTNGCLNLTFTQPTALTDTWDVVAEIRSLEVM